MSAKVISFLNEKGGVGKTTSAISLAGYYSSIGLRTLLIDGDTQANTTGTFGIRKAEKDLSDLLMDKYSFEEVVVKIEEHLDLLPMRKGMSSDALSGMVRGMSYNDEIILTLLIDQMEKYDYIIFDSSPALGILAINYLRASDLCVVPVLPEIYSIEGTETLWKLFTKVRQKNPALKFGGFLITQYNEKEKNNAKKIVFDYIKELQKENKELRRFSTTIRKDLILSESIMARTHIFKLDRKSKAKEDYKNVAEEIIKLTQDANTAK